jgi:hypothetical protein
VSSGKKLTFDDVRFHFENEGYSLLSTEYVRAHEKLKVVCPEKHEYLTTYANFQQGYRCSKCAGNKKHSLDHVKEVVEEVEGYSLLSTEYINSRTKLKISCNMLHEFDMTFGNFQSGKRCPICMEQKHSIMFVKSVIEEEGYSLLSNNYVNNTTKLMIKCNYGHEYSASFASFKHGTRCPVCYNEAIKTILDTEGFKYYRLKVSNETERNYRKHKNTINPSNLPRGRGKYHLDHKYSVYDGFMNNVPIEIVSSVNNLQLLTERENIIKGNNSCISIEDLMKF